MLNPWSADTDTDALAAFRDPDDDWTAASPRDHRQFYACLAIAALPWLAAAVALVWRVLHG